MAIKFDLNKLSVAGVKQNMTYGEGVPLEASSRINGPEESPFLQFQ